MNKNWDIFDAIFIDEHPMLKDITIEVLNHKDEIPEEQDKEEKE